jgi:alkylation response protein AidB-like acyl-CoA dehydrogenase
VAELVETTEQHELRMSLRRMFGGQTACLARHAVDTGHYDMPLWRRVVGELGLAGLAVPVQLGGSGFSRADRGAALHEMGRALLPSPFLSSAVLATETLLAVGSDDLCAELLPRLGGGDICATVVSPALAGGGTGAMLARQVDGRWLVSGPCVSVMDGEEADVLLVRADVGPDRALFAVESGAPGVTRRPLPTLDPSRHHAAVDFVDAPGRLLGGIDTGDKALRIGVAHAVIGLAAEQAGAAERCLEAAVQYAMDRHQFGRPIGSFQAIKHKCADLLLQVESAKSAARFALAVSSEDGSADELVAAAALAGAYCGDAFMNVAAENVQVHGGIGFTWEHDAHLYFRRAKASQVVFGTPADHRRALARHLGLAAAGSGRARRRSRPSSTDLE